MTACKYGDPTCPCQDGDPWHYEGEQPMSVSPENVRRALAVQDARIERLKDAKIKADSNSARLLTELHEACDRAERAKAVVEAAREIADVERLGTLNDGHWIRLNEALSDDDQTSEASHE